MQSKQDQPDERRRESLQSSLIVAAVFFKWLVFNGSAPLTYSTIGKGKAMHVEGHERFIKGLKKLKEIYGKAGEKVIE